MSSLALMRWLESTPDRYDAGMRAVTLGRVDPLHEAVAAAAAPEPGRDVVGRTMKGQKRTTRWPSPEEPNTWLPGQPCSGQVVSGSEVGRRKLLNSSRA